MQFLLSSVVPSAWLSGLFSRHFRPIYYLLYSIVFSLSFWLPGLFHECLKHWFWFSFYLGHSTFLYPKRWETHNAIPIMFNSILSLVVCFIQLIFQTYLLSYLFHRCFKHLFSFSFRLGYFAFIVSEKVRNMSPPHPVCFNKMLVWFF